MAPKNETVRLLVLHESQDNTEQIINMLKNIGIATRPELIKSEDELLDALKDGSWDIMLAGEITNDIPYDTALGQIRKQDKDIPLIVLLDEFDSDMMGETLQAGAADAVVFDSHKHLILAIKRELSNLQHRRARRKAEASLTETEKRCEMLLDNSRDAIAYVHDGMHIYTNASYIELFGYESTDDTEGTTVIDLVAKEDKDRFRDYLRAYIKGENLTQDLHFHGVKADGGKFDAMMQLSAASYDGEDCTQIIIRRDDGSADATLLAEKLKEATSLDQQTGLPNRQRFEEALSETVHKSHKDKSRHALLYLAIDNIQQISQAHGLGGVDAIIKALAKVLTEYCSNSTLARFSDSAFAAILPNIELEAAQEKAQALCKKIHDQLLDAGNGKTQQTSLSIGIAMIGETAPEPAEMLSRAITASDKVRLAQGNGVQAYNPAEQADSSDSALLEILVDAIEKSKFKLLYQPLIDTEGSGGEFYEVFVRLPLADGKMMTPDEFMPVAQRHQLGTKIDRWVLLNAAKQLKEHSQRSPNTRLLLNLTAESLQDTTLAAWIGKLSKAIHPTLMPLVLQFTESDVVSYLKAAKDQTEALTQAGCPVSICRFGTALNPLNTLKHVTVSHIKLDRSFTEDLSNEENMGAIKKLTSELIGQEKKIIVSFVENAPTLSKLWTMGVHYLQGYFLQPPGEKMVYEN